MGRVFRPHYTKRNPDGTRTRVQVRDYYAEYTDAAGAQRRKRIGPDRRAAESALARLQEQAMRKRHNIPDPSADAEARNRDTAGLVAEYLAELSDRGRSAGYRAEVERHLDVLLPACRWYVWADVTDAGLVKFLAKKCAETSPATANGYLRSAKGFANWYADRLAERGPLKGVKPFNEVVDRRRSRRVLSDDELDKLIAAAEGAPERHNTIISGRARAALYLVAAHTGLRASELASLTPRDFALDAAPPTVTVHPKHTKAKRLEPVPLSDALVKFLRKWMKGKSPTARLWPGKWAEHHRQVRWVQRDANRAKLGAGIHFHSLRRQYVTRLIRGGADVDEVRRLARHKSAKTTLDHYAESNLADLAKTVNRTKRLG